MIILPGCSSLSSPYTNDQHRKESLLFYTKKAFASVSFAGFVQSRWSYGLQKKQTMVNFRRQIVVRGENNGTTPFKVVLFISKEAVQKRLTGFCFWFTKIETFVFYGKLYIIILGSIKKIKNKLFIFCYLLTTVFRFIKYNLSSTTSYICVTRLLSFRELCKDIVRSNKERVWKLSNRFWRL